MINYSFIIPHKNSTDLLRKCLDSIPHRDDVQIIIVDDNSDSDKVDFKNFPGLNEKCTEVYLTKEGRGAGYARNIGLKHAVGKWIVFADADDFFNPCIEDAMDTYLNSNQDIIFFKCTSEQAYTGLPGTRFQGQNINIDNAIKTNDFSILLQNTTPVMKFFRHNIIVDNNIKFQEVRWGNDVYFYSKFVSLSKKFLASDFAVYCVTNGASTLSTNDSATVQKIRLNVEMDGIEILIPVMDVSFSLFWLYNRWFKIWNLDKLYAISVIPKLLRKTKGKILKYFHKHFILDLYNNSKLKKLKQSIKK